MAINKYYRCWTCQKIVDENNIKQLHSRARMSEDFDITYLCEICLKQLMEKKR